MFPFPKESLFLGLGFEIFAKFLRVSVLDNLVSEKKVSRKRVSVSENLVAEKKSRYRCRSKFWYHHSVCGVRAALLIERVPTLYQKLLNSHSLNEKAT